MALNPWPTDQSTAKWESSIRLLAMSVRPQSQIPAAVPDDPDTTENEAEEAKAAFRLNPVVIRLHQLGSMVSARIEKQVPGAPALIKDEALLRGVGYFQQAGSGAIRSKEIDVLKTEFSANNQRWFSLSGASSILSPWYAPRGGLIG